MKQKKFGQKIQNWHRPLGSDELKARFRRYRESGESRERYYPWEYDDDWYEEERLDYERWYGDDFFDYWRAQLVRQALAPHYPFQALKAVLPQSADRDMLPNAPPPDLSGAFGLAFAERLNRHVRRIQTYQGDDPELVETIQGALGGTENAQLVIANAPEYARTLMLYAPFWRRSPATWNPGQGVSLQDHLFARYPVPAFLRLRRDCHYYIDDKWVSWLILLGQGVSLKNAAEVFGWDIPGRLPSFLAHVPADLNPLDGCLYAEVLRLGGNATDYRRILDPDLSFVFDLTDLSQEDAQVDFWYETVRWLIRHRNQLSDEDAPLLLAWARHRYIEALREDDGPFRWKGRSLRAVLAQSRAYHQERERLVRYRYANYTWPAHGWDWTPDGEALQGWSVVELTTTGQLIEEGCAMRHCVGSYGWQCDRGQSAIVSVRYQGERRVTVEVRPETGQIIQIYGANNRDPDREELRVADAWHTNVVLPTLTPSAV